VKDVFTIATNTTDSPRSTNSIFTTLNQFKEPKWLSAPSL
jgi:hypothetical protein